MIRIWLWLAIVAMALSGCAGTSNSSAGGGIPSLPWQGSTGSKIGYIRSDEISKKYADYSDADNSLETDNRKWMAEAEKMKESIQAKERELEEVRLILSKDRLEQLEKDLVQERKALQKFQHDTWYSDNSKYTKRRKELMTPIDARVNDAIWKVAESEGLDLIFDTVAGNIVFATEGLDMTELVLEELQR